MHQKGFKEILPKEPTCGLKGLSWVRLGLSWVRLGLLWVRYGSVMGPNNLSHNIILANHKIILLLLIIN